jgi:hypothetical protein
MNWLRSEDLKEEKNVTAPTFIVAGQPAIAFGSLTGSHWKLLGGSDSELDLYCSVRISLLAYPTHDLQKEALMGSRPFREISCALCSKPVDLLIDLSADENGKAVHEECYVKRLTSSSNDPSAALIAS